ncbi:MAG: FadD3 family acyl-CoA ligase [Actinobacteria bacterium]|nr:FadD3 family acyl-CoA ligase [Actinomycetota bacterium]
MTIPGLLAEAAERYPDTTAVVDGDVVLTFPELRDAARAFGAGLVAAGIEPGDRVAIWAPNGVRWIVAALGLWEAGAALVPINTRFKGAEAADILDRSGARALVTVTDFLGVDNVAALAATGVALPVLTTTVVIDGPVPEGALSWDDLHGLATDDDRATLAERSAAVTDDDTADVLFTSGTTGKPKGVVQTHARTLRVATDWVAMTGLRHGDRYLMVNPYFHMFGLKAGILPSIAAGVTMFPEATFDVGRALERVGQERITVLPGAPTIYQSILDHPDRDRHDLSTLRLAVTGAADIPVELIRRIRAELPFEVVVTGYGLTEAGTAAATSPDDDPETVATTVGRARPGFDLRLVDGDGADVPAGETGEVWVRGPSVMSHYLDDPGATAAAVTDDGFLKTGDLGVLDDAGNLKIVGRSKDMFIVGGFNAYPAEIENLLLAHPDIAQTAVIGIPDERLGEVGMAFVVPSAGSTPDPDEIVAWSREHMANYKAPRRVELIDELPVNATGKVVKDDLRARLSNG